MSMWLIHAASVSKASPLECFDRPPACSHRILQQFSLGKNAHSKSLAYVLDFFVCAVPNFSIVDPTSPRTDQIVVQMR
jgi:hypothetical protein